MLNNEVKALINEVIELYSTSSLSQGIINTGVEILENAKELLINGEEEGKILYKVTLVHPYTYSERVENTFPNSANGQILSQNNYCSTQYIDIEGYEYLTLHLNLAHHRGNFYDENKKFIKGYNQQTYSSGEIMEIPENAKYFVGGSASSGELPLIYGYTYNKPNSNVTFEHESDKEYMVTNVVELKQGSYKTGDTVTTRGYYSTGDLGNAVYDIMTEEEYLYLMKKSAYIPKAKTQVDGYGDHLLNNGLVARLRIDNDDMRPEQWGAKGDGITNDCQAFTHMFAKISTGTLTFKREATYVLGLYGGSVTAPTDNPYRNFGCGSLLGGQNFSKPILISAYNLKLNGNNCLITIPDNCFGNNGMGILNFSGHIKNVDLFNFRFDGKGRTLDTNNKNSNHTIFYSSCNTPEDEITLSVHPVGQGEKRSCIENFNIYNNHFFDAGAMYRQAGDWGGDHILIINPTELDGLNIHDNRFEAWGRWVLAIDLGGYGECMKNIKFNNNVCIGANAYEETNTDGNPKYLIDLDKNEFKKLNPKLTDYGLNLQLENWRWRGLGFIDFEARKCFDNVELIGNTIIGSSGWAINGNSRVNQNFLIKDNYWKHVGGGYPYGFELYSGIGSNIKFENNEMYGVGVKPGYFTNNFTFIDNHMTSFIRTFGIAGTIDIENNTANEGSVNRLWNHESNNYDDNFISMEEAKENGIKVIFKNNDCFFDGIFNNFVEIEKDMAKYIDFDIEYKNIKRSILSAFNTNLVIDFSKLDKSNQNLFLHGVQSSAPFEINPTSIAYFKKGQTAITSMQNLGVLKGKYYREDLVENFNTYGTFGYNWGIFAQKHGYTNVELICTQDGYLPGTCEYGFANQCTHINYILNTNNNNIGKGAYIHTDDNLYYVVSETSKIFEIPTHEEGIKTYTHEGYSVDLVYIGKIGKFELRCI